MIVLGDVVAVVGVGLAMNVAGATDRIVAWAKPFPRWVKWPMTDDPTGYRLLGAVLLLMGALFIASGRG